MSMRRDLRGRSILITGASRGIGRRAAVRLAKLGAKLVVTARSEQELATLVEEIRAMGGTAEAIPCDLTDSIQRELLVKATVERHGGLDVLVNAAGVASFGEFATSNPEILRKIFEVNFFAPVELMRLCRPHLEASYRAGGGTWRPAILNLASIAGRCGFPSFPEHCASKHAFVGLSETVRMEYKPLGIDVLLVLPGIVQSDDISRHLLRDEGKIYIDFRNAQPADEVADALVASLIHNRLEQAVGGISRLVWWARRLWPRVLRWVMKRKVQKFAARQGKG